MYFMYIKYAQEAEMERMSAAEVRKELSETLNRVAYGGDRVVIQRRGRDVAALISLEDLEFLERIEDQLDIKAARAAIEEARAAGEATIPWEDVKKELGL